MRRLFPKRAGSEALLALLIPLQAHAGMTMPVFTDVAHARLEVLSFFLFIYLTSAFVFQRIWNSLAKDFPALPPLRYRGALGALIVCGLFIYVVLTMISGARELMTPGAWARSGIHYKIREPERDPKPWIDSARRTSMERLRASLWRYAQQHGGAFPANREQEDFPQTEWTSIDPNQLSFGYVSGLKPDLSDAVLAYEPASFGPERLALLANGEIVKLKPSELTERVNKQIERLEATLVKKPSHE
jgi:hypothetical protein